MQILSADKIQARPIPHAQESARALRTETVANMGETKAAFAEHSFDVNSSS